MEAPASGGNKNETLVLIGVALLAVIIVVFLMSRSNGTAGGVVPGLSDGTQQALLAAQTAFDGNATQLAIAKSADAVQALSDYTNATTTAQTALAGIRGATMQAQIGANSSTQIAQIQSNATVSVAQLQRDASVASSNASVGVASAQATGAAAVANVTAGAALGVASQQEQATTNIANAQKNASEFNSVTSFLGGIASAFGL